jgi:hypothetical protein
MTGIALPCLGRERAVQVMKVWRWQCVCEAVQQNSDTVNQCELTRFPLYRNDLLAVTVSS